MKMHDSPLFFFMTKTFCGDKFYYDYCLVASLIHCLVFKIPFQPSHPFFKNGFPRVVLIWIASNKCWKECKFYIYIFKNCEFISYFDHYNIF